MNNKTNLLEEYVKLVDNTKKQNKKFEVFLFLIAIIVFVLIFCFISLSYKVIFVQLKEYKYENTCYFTILNI